MSRVFIAEKYKVAKAIASALPGATTGGPTQGWFDKPDGTRVTWASGHILELCMPEDYDPSLKRWRVEDYPVFPEDWKLKPIKETAKQLNIIARLLKEATTVVHAGDPDREGQLLVDEILVYCAYAGPVRRVLPNDNEPSAIADALRNEFDNKAKFGRYQAGLARQRADWLVGINATRVATQGLGDGRLISIGRVQTIVVWLVVKRDELIEKFSSRPFYEIEIDLKTQAGETVTLTHAPAEADRMWDKSVAEALAATIRAIASAHAHVNVENKVERSPLPYALSDFQQHASRLHKWTAANSLKILQATYLAGFTTYPRTDTPYLRQEQVEAVPDVLAAIRAFKPLSEAMKTFSATPGTPNLSRRLFDSSKVNDHHGIIPSRKNFEASPADRKGLEAIAYEMVARRYLMALMPNRQFTETSISVTLAGVKASAKAERTTVIGWRALDPKSDGKTLPSVQDGDLLTICAVRLVPRKTTPPKPYTEDTLLGDMKGIAKYVPNPEMKARLTKGIGTSATQAATIETIVAREYVYRTRGTIRSTEFGRNLIASMPKALVDPTITGLWEESFDHLENGLVTLDAFMEKIEAFTSRVIDELKVLSQGHKIKGAGAPPAASQTEKAAKAPKRKKPRSTLPSSART